MILEQWKNSLLKYEQNLQKRCLEKNSIMNKDLEENY